MEGNNNYWNVGAVFGFIMSKVTASDLLTWLSIGVAVTAIGMNSSKWLDSYDARQAKKHKRDQNKYINKNK